MSAVIVDGKSAGEAILGEVGIEANKLLESGVEPHLSVVIVGEDPASQVYVRNKERACKKCGIKSTRIDMPVESTQDEIIEVVRGLNADIGVHGILVQSPTPNGIDELAIASAIDPDKDVDGFHPINLGKIVQGNVSGLLPCTPSGVMHLLKVSGFDTVGKKAVVIGRSRIVGMPMALLLSQRGVDSTVTIAHSKTDELRAICEDSDIVIAAIGRIHTVKSDWIKPGAFVADVGISRTSDGKLAGDVDPSVADVAGWVTPVPGGVGPMTIAMLMQNTVTAARNQAI
jgi:methylenetetrahydrofolate dehydrogenase (NADP+)/methenyltetrahydrofolate cyclohydrolase